MAPGVDTLKPLDRVWTALGRRRTRLLAAVVVAVAVVQLLGIVRVGVRDPLLSPFLAPDSPDWLSAGLELRGFSVICNDRPPLLPALYSLLDAVHAWGAIPALHLLFFQLLVAGVAALAWQVTCDVELALLSALVTQLNGVLWYQAHFVMADVPAAAVSTLAVVALLGASTRRAGTVAFALLLPAALSTQDVLPILAPPLALYLWSSRRSLPRSRFLACGAVLVLSPLLVTLLHRHVTPDAARAPYSIHTILLGFQLEGLAFYPWALLCLFGPFVLLLPVFLLDFLGERPAPSRWLLVTWFVSGFAFFALFYRYLALRFLLFFAPPVLIGIAWVLRRLMDLGGRRLHPVAAALPLGVFAWFALLTPQTPYYPAICLAPGLAVLPVKPDGEPRDPNHFAFAGALHVDRRPETSDFAWRYVRHPERARPAIESGMFSLREIAELVALGHAAGPGRTVAIVDSPGPTMLYFVSAGLRAPARVLGAEADAACGEVPGAGLLLIRRGTRTLPCFVPYLATDTFRLLRRAASGS